MTQTPRDWQKDMEMCKDITSMSSKSEFVRMAEYWIQEAKKWRERYEQRPTFELLEAAQALYEHHNARADAAEIRVKELEAIIKAANDENERLLNGDGDEAYAEAWSTLYPDTPAPTKEE